MKRIFFITGTDTGVGKTVLTSLLAAYLRGRSVRAAALKPICSGGRDDARILEKALDGALTLDEINPWYFRAPIAPILAAKRENKRLKLAPVLAHIRAMRKKFDVVLIEGAGGLLSPLGTGFDSRDLMAATGATPVIVAPNKLGVVNHVLLTLEALPPKSRTKAKIVLMMPEKRDAAAVSNSGLLEQLSVQNVFRLPWFGTRFSINEVLQKPYTRKVLAMLKDCCE